MSQTKPHKCELPARGTTLGEDTSLVYFLSQIWDDQHAFLTGCGEP